MRKRNLINYFLFALIVTIYTIGVSCASTGILTLSIEQYGVSSGEAHFRLSSKLNVYVIN